MQHDLKIKEIRQPDPLLAAWCICGGWKYVSTTKLFETPVVEGFIEHLDYVAPYVRFEQKYLVDADHRPYDRHTA